MPSCPLVAAVGEPAVYCTERGGGQRREAAVSGRRVWQQIRGRATRRKSAGVRRPPRGRGEPTMADRVAVCVLLALLANVAGADEVKKKVEPRLVEGKFGKALDADVTPLAFTGDERYRRPPLTVECWALSKDKRTFNVFVSSDPKVSSRHWEIYSYLKTGYFSAYLPGYVPSEVVSAKDVCDGKWHHLAFTHDGKQALLYVDGKLVREQALEARENAQKKDGPLSI